MKTYIGTLIFMCSLLVCSCHQTANSPHLYDEGISQELAVLRKQEIKELKYKLYFNIPETKSVPINGEITIEFNLDTPQEVILDFREKPEKIQSVAINGQTARYEFRNEHIILPQNDVVKGKNTITIQFVAGDQSLNRNDEFLYTLLVPDRARTLFPCFEQPNLKATFTLQLDVPTGWKAVSNTYITKEETKDTCQTVTFAPTEPLSTYLFSFVAGKLEQKEYAEGDRKISAYYRETDPEKVAQLDTIFKQVAASLNWLEKYTGVPYPFAKYDFIILPGFQYGGMEHTGATLYNDTQMFLSQTPTPDEELRRTQLIAHETAHMWFGDLVTMNWFDDVWTKEVFANYFAALITEPLFPQINHQLNWMKTYTAASLSEDRTPGTTSIRQPLDNLQDAGLIYGQIIYNKAPVMMVKLVELMGKEPFREGIQEYLNTYAYANATWDDLIQILDSKTDQDLAAFSDVWVNRKGMPVIHFDVSGNQLAIRQQDPYYRGLNWPQKFDITLCGERDTTIEASLTDSLCSISLPFTPTRILPNTDGRGYGLFIPDENSLHWLLEHWQEMENETTRQAVLMMMYENYQAKIIPDRTWITVLLNGIQREKNPLTASTLASYLSAPLREISPDERSKMENKLYELSNSHSIPSCRIQLLRLLITEAASPDMIQRLYTLWKTQSSKQLNERDYTTLAYELSLRLPGQSEKILETQRQRIHNPDRLRQFDFISRAMNADTLKLDSLFQSLQQAENRRIEPWAATTLSYLNHPTREDYAVKYIRPALEELVEVQRTGDIFFPRNWVGALLRNHSSEAAYREVEVFLSAHPDYSPLLKNKILQAAYPLYRKYAEKEKMNEKNQGFITP